MMKTEIERYNLNFDKEKEIWNNAIFVFDSSALLNFYEYSEETRKNIFDTTFKVLKDRLWIPFHVNFEYLKNRETTLKKPTKLYYDLKDNYLKNIGEQLNQIINRTKKNNKHPFLNQEPIVNFQKVFLEFEKQLKDEIDTKINEIINIASKDTVLNSFKKYFQVGKEFSYSQILQIVKEGELRYKFAIPPGYKDEDDKIGFQIFGDLIIWKQILEYAKIINRPILFITDDVKEDWWGLKSKNQPEKPREELIDEIYEFANVPFWMYTSSGFLETAKKLLDTKIKENALIEVRNFNIHFSAFNAELSFAKWLLNNNEENSEIILYDNQRDIGVDVLVKKQDGFRIGYEIKYFTRINEGQVLNRLRHIVRQLNQNLIESRLDKFVIVIVTGEEDTAKNIQGLLENEKNQRNIFGEQSIDFEYLIGYMVDNEFRLI